MKHLLHLSFSALVCSSLLFTSCRRHKDDVDADVTELAEHADDDAAGADAQEAGIEDIDMFFNHSSIPLPGARVDFSMCGVSGVDSTTTPGTYVITFDGATACGIRNAVRAGSITLSLTNGARWRDAGAVVNVTFTDYKVTRTSRHQGQRTYVLNGSGTITNVVGGLRRELGNGGISTVRHRIRFTGMKTNWKGHDFTNWNTAKTRTYGYSEGIYSLQVTGDESVNGIDHVGAWGTGRRGQTVYTQFATPITAVSTYGFDHPTGGQKVHQGLVRSLTVTFGVDSLGNATAAGTAPYGYKYDFVGPHRSESSVIAY